MAKRGAERQLTKDDREDEVSGGDVMGCWEKADAVRWC